MKPSILMVDDEVSFTEVMKQYFEPRGYDIDIASSGGRCIDLIKNKKYGIILLDFKMAGLNGDEVMREIRTLDPVVKIVFISAYSDSGKTQERLISEGAYAFIEKPVKSLKSLEETIIKAARPDQEEGTV